MVKYARLLALSGLLAALCGGALAAGSGTPPTPPDVLITITAAGDVTHGSDRRKSSNPFRDELRRQGDDLSFPFRNVQAYFAADDLTLVNYEGALTTAPPATENTYCFAGPPQYAQALALGHVEAVALDNNHVFDHGTRGYEDTQKALADAGVAYSGNGQSAIFTAQGVRIGMLSYRTFDSRYAQIHRNMPEDITALRQAGCALVVVSYHWGEERATLPNERQVKLGRATVDAGADLVLGHHSHVINPIELYKGKYICYSLANFSFAGNTNPSDKDTFLFQQRFYVQGNAARDAGMRVIPCRISSTPDYNDFIPTPYEEPDAARVLERLQKLGEKLNGGLRVYPTAWLGE
ncbi:MAG: CapA family protein [Oscillospiraceae bacterium]|jgi:poly-gamma-glutamate synthesis protein (capsule biosynthesis protein)|nr:CapA family protein [Oscillospiraceae bacterium]